MPHPDSNRPQRRSIRLRNFDYTRAGIYFITICVQERLPLLGSVRDGVVHLSEAGVMVRSEWEGVPEKIPGVGLDAWVLMPNHLHGLVVLGVGDHVGSLESRGDSPSLAEVVRVFKSITTHLYTRRVAERGWARFPGRLWQRNYYERILRDEDTLQRARRYIVENPLNWNNDPENPAGVAWAGHTR